MKRNNKKRKIMKVAEEVFAEKSFDGASMQEIADRVGIQKSALYYYFKNKRDIYESLIRDIYEQLKEEVRGQFMQGRDLEEKIGILINSLVDFWGLHPRFPRIITQEALSGSELVYSELIPRFWLPMFTESIAEMRSQIEGQEKIREVDLPLLAINIFGMSAFYFFVAPILQAMSGEDYYTAEKLSKLKDEIRGMVFEGIRKRSDGVA